MINHIGMSVCNFIFIFTHTSVNTYAVKHTKFQKYTLSKKRKNSFEKPLPWGYVCMLILKEDSKFVQNTLLHSFSTDQKTVGGRIIFVSYLSRSLLMLQTYISLLTELSILQNFLHLLRCSSFRFCVIVNVYAKRKCCCNETYSTLYICIV